MNTITVNMGSAESGIEEGSGIQNIVSAYSAMKDVTTYPGAIGMTLPKVRESNMGWYVTKEGRVFNANGFTYDGKTYFSGSLYQEGELPAEDTRQEPNAERIYVAIQGNTNVVTEATGTGGTVGVTEVGGGVTPGTQTEPETPATYSIGDTITRTITRTIGGNTYYFYVIEDSGASDTIVKAITKERITTALVQDSSAEGQNFCTEQMNGYWVDSATGSLKSKYGTSYSNNSLEETSNIEESDGKTAMYYAQEYGKIVPGAQKGRLMTYTEATTLQSSTKGSQILYSQGDYATTGSSQNYWLGSATNNRYLDIVFSNNTRTEIDNGNATSYKLGVRPIIIFSKSEL